MTGGRTGATRRRLTLCLTLALSALAACGGKGEKTEGGGSGGAGGGGGKRPVAVQVVAVAPRTVAETREVTGTLAAAREARLLAQLEGAVTRVLVDEGDRVRAGQLLATFDNSVQAAELAGARTRARVARAAAERASRLLALGAASRAEQEEAAATLREAAGALRGAEARAAYGEIRAPFAGIVTAVRVNAGDVVGARQEVAVVADPAELRVEVPVSELDVVRLSPGDAVPVTVDALPGREFAGRVARIYPTVDAATRQGVVEVALRRAAPELRPGLLARLTLTVARAEGVLAAPLDAVRRDVRDQPYVYVVQDVFVREPADAGGGEGGSKGEGKGESKGGDAKKGASGDEGRKRGEGGEADTVVRRAQIVLRRPVRVGLRGGDNYVQLAEGVRPGDRVVVTGDQELSDSARVRVLPTREGGDRAARAVAEGGAAGGAGSGTGSGAGEAGGTPGGGANAGAGAGGRAGDAAVGGGAASTGAGNSAGGAVGGGALGAAAASGARSAASAGAAAGAAGSTAPGAARTPGAVGGVGGAGGGGLSGAASASTGVPSRGGRAGATGGRAGARAGGTGRASGTAGAGTGAGGPGGGGGG